MEFNFLLFQLFNGLTEGMILFIVASGLSLVFGVLRVINFAHGALYMIGAFLAFTLSTLFAEFTLGAYLLVMILAPLGVSLIGLGLEVTLFRRIYRKEHLLQLLLTYALILILDDVVRLIWGGDIRNVPRPPAFSGATDFAGLSFPTYNIFILCLGPVIAIGLWLLLHKTHAGNLIRASVTHHEMVGALGANVNRVMTGTFVLGCALAGIGGVLMSALANIDLSIGMERIIDCFAVVVIGGLGSVGGALLGSLIIGVGKGYLSLVMVRLAMVFPFFIMALVLIIRPWGLFGKPER